MKKKNPKATERPKRGGYLWEVKGGKARMYLNGTVHMVPGSFFPLKDEIISCFDSCNNLALEILLDDIDKIKITDDIASNKEYIYEDGDSLYNHFPKERVITLRNYLVKNQICSVELAQKFHKLKPEVVMSLVRHGLFDKMGVNLEYMGIDYYFAKRAREMNKNMLELESEEFQRKILAEMAGKRFFIGFSGNANRRPQFEKFPILDEGRFERFKRFKVQPIYLGMIARVAGELYDNERLIEKERRKLLTRNNPLVGKRDEEMCRKLEEMLETKNSYFVAVGAMHLIGSGSIVDRLLKKGYQVIRIC